MYCTPSVTQSSGVCTAPHASRSLEKSSEPHDALHTSAIISIDSKDDFVLTSSSSDFPHEPWQPWWQHGLTQMLAAAVHDDGEGSDGSHSSLTLPVDEGPPYDSVATSSAFLRPSSAALHAGFGLGHVEEVNSLDSHGRSAREEIIGLGLSSRTYHMPVELLKASLRSSCIGLKGLSHLHLDNVASTPPSGSAMHYEPLTSTPTVNVALDHGVPRCLPVLLESGSPAVSPRGSFSGTYQQTQWNDPTDCVVVTLWSVGSADSSAGNSLSGSCGAGVRVCDDVMGCCPMTPSRSANRRGANNGDSLDSSAQEKDPQQQALGADLARTLTLPMDNDTGFRSLMMRSPSLGSVNRYAKYNNNSAGGSPSKGMGVVSQKTWRAVSSASTPPPETKVSGSLDEFSRSGGFQHVRMNVSQAGRLGSPENEAGVSLLTNSTGHAAPSSPSSSHSNDNGTCKGGPEAQHLKSKLKSILDEVIAMEAVCASVMGGAHRLPPFSPQDLSSMDALVATCDGSLTQAVHAATLPGHSPFLDRVTAACEDWRHAPDEVEAVLGQLTLLELKIRNTPPHELLSDAPSLMPLVASRQPRQPLLAGYIRAPGAMTTPQCCSNRLTDLTPTSKNSTDAACDGSSSNSSIGNQPVGPSNASPSSPTVCCGLATVGPGLTPGSGSDNPVIGNLSPRALPATSCSESFNNFIPTNAGPGRYDQMHGCCIGPLSKDHCVPCMTEIEPPASRCQLTAVDAANTPHRQRPTCRGRLVGIRRLGHVLGRALGQGLYIGIAGMLGGRLAYVGLEAAAKMHVSV